MATNATIVADTISLCGHELEPELLPGTYCLVPYHLSSQIAVIVRVTDRGLVVVRKWSNSNRAWSDELAVEPHEIVRLSYHAHEGDFAFGPPRRSYLFA